MLWWGVLRWNLARIKSFADHLSFRSRFVDTVCTDEMFLLGTIPCITTLLPGSYTFRLFRLGVFDNEIYKLATIRVRRIC